MEKLSRILHDLDQGNINVELAKQQVLDLFSVSGSLGFDQGYEKGYNDATKEACAEIAKNYQPIKR